MLNKSIFEGYLGADPELRTTPTGMQCCTFRVGVARNYKDESGKAPTDWISCVAWRSTAEHINRAISTRAVLSLWRVLYPRVPIKTKITRLYMLPK